MQVRYYNGQQAKGHPAQAFVEGARLRLYYNNGYSGFAQQYWELSKASRPEFGLHQPILIYTDGDRREQIEFENIAAFNAFMAQVPSHLPVQRKGFYRSSYLSSGYKLGLLGLGLLACLAGIYFLLLPGLVTLATAAVPRSTEVSLGKKLAQGYLGREKTDVKLTRLADDFYSELGIESGYDVEVTVTESSEVNAFALPGGTIVVTKAIIQQMDRPEQLAALLGHEAGHVELRHSLRSIIRSVGTYALVSVVIGDISGLSAVLLENANAINGLSYSRDAEREADQFSIDFMKKEGLNIAGMAQLMEILQKQEKDSQSSLPAFLSTHPLTDERIATAKAAAKKQWEAGNEIVPITPRMERLFALLKRNVGDATQKEGESSQEGEEE